MLCLFRFPSGSDGKESACNAEDLDPVPGLERSPGEGNDHAVQYFGILQIKHQGAEKQLSKVTQVGSTETVI